MQFHPTSLFFEDGADMRLEKCNQGVGEWIAERCMCDYTSTLKERARSNALRPINNLRREREIARGDFLPQAAHSGECDDSTHTEGFEGGDVSAGGDCGGGVGVVWAVPG